MAHVVVVGSGLAGLTVALRANDRHDVTLVTKASVSESNTRYAQGGIAAVLFDDDRVEDHVTDTVTAAAGLGDERMARILCSEGPARVRELIELGVPFDREGAALARGREAAHSASRIVHAGGDATGAAVEETLVRALVANGVLIREHTFLADLVVRDGEVVGLELIGPDGHETLFADIVVLATGGAGQLFEHTTNPVIATGDGAAAALRAGAVLADVEFVQFHPTALAVPGTPLVSEAVRGEGAVLRDLSGRRFMRDVHPDAELAPRDVVARGIADEMATQHGSPVLLDATALDADLLARRFPGITRLCSMHGLDLGRDLIPVTPAAHYWMGGVRTDDRGRTSLPGLFAVGEVACTGVHGANRLASNSLLEALVFAWRSVEAFDERRPFAPWRAFTTLEFPANVRAGTLDREAGQRRMWADVGLTRDHDGLARMLRESPTPVLARDASVHDRETANLALLGHAIALAAQAREESRGAHYRRDHPSCDIRPSRLQIHAPHLGVTHTDATTFLDRELSTSC